MSEVLWGGRGNAAGLMGLCHWVACGVGCSCLAGHTGLKYMYSLWKNDKIHIDIMEYTSEMALFSRVRKLWFIEYM